MGSGANTNPKRIQSLGAVWLTFLVDVWHVGGKHLNNKLVAALPTVMAPAVFRRTLRSVSPGGGAHFWGGAITPGD